MSSFIPPTRPSFNPPCLQFDCVARGREENKKTKRLDSPGDRGGGKPF